MLNLSIDVDYVTHDFHSSLPPVDYDDIDSFTELIIEAVAGNGSYTSENDDDDGHPIDKGVEKYNIVILNFEQFAKPQVFTIKNDISWTACADRAKKTCKGFFDILSPPPKG